MSPILIWRHVVGNFQKQFGWTGRKFILHANVRSSHKYLTITCDQNGTPEKNTLVVVLVDLLLVGMAAMKVTTGCDMMEKYKSRQQFLHRGIREEIFFSAYTGEDNIHNELGDVTVGSSNAIKRLDHQRISRMYL